MLLSLCVCVKWAQVAPGNAEIRKSFLVQRLSSIRTEKLVEFPSLKCSTKVWMWHLRTWFGGGHWDLMSSKVSANINDSTVLPEVAIFNEEKLGISQLNSEVRKDFHGTRAGP